MKNYDQIKNLPFKELKGISQKTIDIHWGKLYQGYVKKWQEIQEKLKNAVVGIAGLGGLGSNVAIALARTDIGKLIIADFDKALEKSKG